MRFSIWKGLIFRKVKENKGLRGGVLTCAAQAITWIDTEIAENKPFQMKTI